LLKNDERSTKNILAEANTLSEEPALISTRFPLHLFVASIGGLIANFQTRSDRINHK